MKNISKAGKLLNYFSEYSWSVPSTTGSVYVDLDNNTVIDGTEKTGDKDDVFDNVDNHGDDRIAGNAYPSIKLFPDLHYNTIDQYYNQMMTNPDNMITRSCQMCSNNQKMHGLRYCRPCYDRFRYKRRKVLNAPSSVIMPFSADNLY